MTEQPDQVNSPPHYQLSNGMEVINVLEETLGGVLAWQGYLQGNVVKYVLRSNFKGKQLEDLKKAQYYLNKLIESVEE
jgi:hypothetical protein